MKINLNNKNINLEVLKDKVCVRLNDFNNFFSFGEKFDYNSALCTMAFNYEVEEYAYEIKGEKYYDINILLLFSDEYSKNDTAKIYRVFKENGLDKFIQSFICDKIENEKIFNTDFVDMINNFDDFIITAFKSTKNEVDCDHRFYFEEFLLEDSEMLLEKIREKYNIDESFGRVMFPDALEIIFKKLNGDYTYDQDDSLEFDNFQESTFDTITYKAAYLLYNIVKEKPYYNHNHLIAGIFMMYYLYINNALTVDGHYLFSSSDLTYITDLCERYEETEAIKLISSFLSLKNKGESQELKLSLRKLKEEYSQENLTNYVVAFVENQYINYGFYDYFDSYGRGVKLHYGGTFFNFKLNVYETMKTKNLVFDVLGMANIESMKVSHPIEFISELYNEIKLRATKSLNKELKKKIIDKVKHESPIIDNITFVILWNYRIGE